MVLFDLRVSWVWLRVSLAAWSTDTALEELNKIHAEETLCYFKTVCYESDQTFLFTKNYFKYNIDLIIKYCNINH